jgi:hypothetical protein
MRDFALRLPAGTQPAARSFLLVTRSKEFDMTEQKNEGEGNHTAARAYNDEQHRFAQSGKVQPAAEDARKAVESAEGKELRNAERLGKAHAKGEDPALKR